jgi:hypothetical protein
LRPALGNRAKNFQNFEGCSLIPSALLEYLRQPSLIRDGAKYFYRHHLAKLYVDKEIRQWESCRSQTSDMRFFCRNRWVEPESWETQFDASLLDILDRPVILLGKGGGGTRLLALAARDCDIFIGNLLNKSNDTLEMALALYQGILRKAVSLDVDPRALTVSHLRLAAAQMIRKTSKVSEWGFKLPESLLLLPEIDKAFPKARYVFMFPNLMLTCLRKPHLTAQPDNPVGNVCLYQAYTAAGRDPVHVNDDPPSIRMAFTTLHQISQLNQNCCAKFKKNRYYECEFDQFVHNPDKALNDLSAWLDTDRVGLKLMQTVDISRAQKAIRIDADIKEKVIKILDPLLNK